MPVLVVDDDPAVLDVLCEMLRATGFLPCPCGSGSEAIEQIKARPFPVVLLDLYMPAVSGLQVIPMIKEIRPQTEIVIVTGQPSLETTLAAIDERVFGYLIKPPEISLLSRVVRSAAERYRLARENDRLLQELQQERNQLRQELDENRRALVRQLDASRQFIGASDGIRQVRQQIARVAPSDMNVLLRGETGTGKEIVARLIADLGGRDSHRFVKINCPAIPETLLESELFGHEAGAFTGAHRRKPGRLEMGTEGTVLLDEIGDLPLSLQVKLLQVLEQKEFCRVGGTQPIKVNARIVATTNRPIEEMIGEGRFRSDLFYRLDQYRICLPPLREHLEDIPLLVEHLLEKHGDPSRYSSLYLSTETLARLRQYSWPGNVRELETTVRRFILTGEENVFGSHLQAAAATTAGHALAPPHDDPVLSLEEAEKRAILRALERSSWNRRKAADLLNIGYSTLRRKIQDYNLEFC